MVLYNTPPEKEVKKVVVIPPKYAFIIDKMENLFKETEKVFLLNISYDSTIYYANFYKEFEALLKTDKDSSKFFMAIIDLYKRVLARAKYYERPEMQMKCDNCYNSHSA